MLGIFRTNQIGANLWVLFYVIALRLPIFIYPQEWTPQNAGIFSQNIYDWVGTQGWLPDALALVFIFVQAVMVNLIAARFRISKEVTMFPGVFYVLMTALLPVFLHLSPVLMGNTFLLAAVMSLFASYKKNASAGAIFNTGFWIGFASLFYFSNIVFVLLGIIGLFILRSFRLNEMLMVIIGALVPLFLVATIYFFNDRLVHFWNFQFVEGFGTLDFVWSNHWKTYAAVGFFGFLLLVAIVSLNIYFQKQSIQAQKSMRVLFNFFLVAGIALFFQNNIQVHHLLLFAIPLAFLLPLNFVNMQNKAAASTIHLIWLFATLGMQFYILNDRVKLMFNLWQKQYSIAYLCAFFFAKERFFKNIQNMKFGVVVFPGSNCDDDMMHVLGTVMQQEVMKLWHKETKLPDFEKGDCVVLPGGFSYGDYLRAGAIARFSPIMKAVIEFANNGGYVWGICNGFQVLCEAGLLPGALLRNDHQKFVCKNVYLKTMTTNSAITSKITSGNALKIPIAHAEGRYHADQSTIDELVINDQILFKYCNAAGQIAASHNPNGSISEIAGICNKTRNVFGMMPHPERASENILGNQDGKIMFESLVATAKTTITA